MIGNDSYQKVEPLKNARNDARLMAGILKQAGFDVNQASDLNRDSLWTTIDTFKGRISKGDEVVFYFAGHGVQIGANQLLLATDIPADNEAQVVRNGVPLIDVQDALKDARVAVLLLDACRDNPFPKTGTRTIGGTRGLSPPEPSTGQIIMMSAGRNQKALDRVPGEPHANGLFTWELSQVLKTPGVEIRAALEQVKERVDDKARKAGHEQRPSLVNDLRGNFYLLPSVRPEPNPSTRPPVPGPAQGSGLSLDDLEREEATRKEWAQWQVRMKADFDKTAAFKGSADLQAKAWERFLATWGQDNPLSGEDEGLRAQAQGRMQERQQEAQRLAAVAPAPAPVTPVNTPQPATATTLDGRYQLLAGGAEVKDLQTGLVWQRCSVGQQWNGQTCTGEVSRFNFDEAQALSRNGWRVPSKDELASLVPKQEVRPTIHAQAFPGTPTSLFWTSTPNAGDSGNPWVVGFRDGLVDSNYRYSLLHVRLVR